MTESTSTTPTAALEALAREGAREPLSSAEWVADRLRERIIDGTLLPGIQLSEKHVGKALDVSRNTLREAFRLLTHEGLLDYRLHHGVFVRVLSSTEVTELYWLRSAVECAAIRALVPLSPGRAAPLYDLVDAAEDLAVQDDWIAAGTANMRLHTDLVGLVGSSAADTVTRQVMAQVRLAFHSVNTPRQLHEPFIARNRLLLDRMVTGPAEDAVAYLTAYLADSEQTILAAIAERATTAT